MLSKLLHEEKENTARRYGISLKRHFFNVMALEMRVDISLKDSLSGGCHTPGCYNEVPWTVWHINNRTLHLTAMEAGSPRSKQHGLV